jgi:hypothetical protein
MNPIQEMINDVLLDCKGDKELEDGLIFLAGLAMKKKTTIYQEIAELLKDLDQ